MKKTLLWIIAMMVSTAMRAFDFSAVAPTGQTLYYNILTDNEVAVTAPNSTSWGSYEQPADSLVIPATVINANTTYHVVEVRTRAFADCNDLTCVVVSDGIKHISMMAFFHCEKLKSVHLPASLQSIAVSAFDGTAFYSDTNRWTPQRTLIVDAWIIKQSSSWNGTIEIADGVVGVANNAFLNCKGITYIEFPSSFAFMGQEAMRNCTNLDTLRLLCKNPPSIGEDCFLGTDGVVVAIPCNTMEKYELQGQWQAQTLVEDTCTTPILPPDTLIPPKPIPPFPIGIDEVETENIVVTTIPVGVVIQSTQDRQIQVFDASGRCLYRLHSQSDNTQLPLPATGLYFIRVDDIVQRVAYCK